MSNPMQGMMQINGCNLTQLQAQNGPRGVMLEFQPHAMQGQMAPVRIALTEQQARDLCANIQRVFSAPPQPGRQSS